MLTVGTSALSETAVETNVILCLHSSHTACLICLSLRQRIPFLASVVLFWAALEVWAMSELACGVTLVFTVSPLPFPFLSFLELPLGTSAMSFYKGKETHSNWLHPFSQIHAIRPVLDSYGRRFQTHVYRVNSQCFHLVSSLLCYSQKLLWV